MIDINRRKKVLIILCLLIAIGLGYAQFIYFSALGEQEPLIEVLVLKEDVLAGQDIKGKLTVKAIPKSAI